jgi:hypothetical protein
MSHTLRMMGAVCLGLRSSVVCGDRPRKTAGVSSIRSHCRTLAGKEL